MEKLLLFQLAFLLVGCSAQHHHYRHQPHRPIPYPHPHPPIPSPSYPPVKPPTKPPVHPPVKPPTAPPVKPSTHLPVKPPTSLPVKPPAHPPVKPPTSPPVKPPAHPPVKPPTSPPVKPPAQPPVKPPTSPPVKPPAQPPVKPPTQPPVKPPTYPPVKPPTTPPVKPPSPYPVPKKAVAVQGVVYCKNCSYVGIDTLLGAKPLPGATVVLKCRKGKTKLVKSATTDKNGYFFIEAPKGVNSNKATKYCRVYLAAPPRGGSCKHPTNLNGGIFGGILKPQETLAPLPYSLFTVGPFAFAPPKRHCTNN